MKNSEHLNVKDLSPGSCINEEVYYLKTMKEKGNGQGYVLVFTDKTGTVQAHLHKETYKEEYISLVGGAVKVGGFVDLQNGGPYIRIFSLEKPAPEEVDNTTLVKSLTKDERNFLRKEMESLIERVEHPGYNALLRFVFRENIINKMAEFPATLVAEACFCGGLLHKTVTVTKMAYEQAKIFDGFRTEIFNGIPEIDYSLLVSAGLLHAIGKIREYAQTIPFQKTELGYYQGPRELTMQTIVACENRMKVEIADTPEITPLEHARLSSAILSMYREQGMHTITREGTILSAANNQYRSMDSHVSAQLLAVEQGAMAGFVYDTRFGGYVEVSRDSEPRDNNGGEKNA